MPEWKPFDWPNGVPYGPGEPGTRRAADWGWPGVDDEDGQPIRDPEQFRGAYIQLVMQVSADGAVLSNSAADLGRQIAFREFELGPSPNAKTTGLRLLRETGELMHGLRYREAFEAAYIHWRPVAEKLDQERLTDWDGIEVERIGEDW